MSERTVAVVTGTRAEYGLLKSPMEAICAHEDLSLTTVATGMHLSPQYGKTVDRIRDDGFAVDHTVEMLVDGDSTRVMAKSVGLGFLGLADTFEEADPDIVLVLGDRGEAFAAGVTAAHMNVPVGHIHGGDSMDGAVIDDSVRHALTKFAHVHFPASESSAERIRGLGEEPWRVTTAGGPGIDDIRASDYTDPERVFAELGLSGSGPVVVVVQHPVTIAEECAGEQMERTLDAVKGVEGQPVVVYPNSDAGGQRIIDTIESHPVGETAETFKSLPRDQYLGLLEGAAVLVGNSSSGIIESPSLDLPVVNVGPRQAGRERAPNVIDVPHETERIESAIERALNDDKVRQEARRCRNPYDHGGAGARIADRLASVELNEELLRKKMTY